MKTTKLFVALAAVSGAVWLAACSTPEARIQNHPEIYAQITPQEQALVKAGQVGLGFGPDAVKLALGDPDRMTVRMDARGELRIWHYTETVYYDGAFLYGGPYWGGWGRRRGGWGAWGAWGSWGPYPVGPVSTYDRFRVEFRNGKVIAFNQESQ